jgi:hypothetical protein
LIENYDGYFNHDFWDHMDNQNKNKQTHQPEISAITTNGTLSKRQVQTQLDIKHGSNTNEKITATTTKKTLSQRTVQTQFTNNNRTIKTDKPCTIKLPPQRSEQAAMKENKSLTYEQAKW